MFIEPARSQAVTSYAGGIRIVCPGKTQIGVLHAFPIGFKNTWICVGIAVEVLRNLRKRLALLAEVILDLLLVLGVLQLCNLTWLTPWIVPTIPTAFCITSAEAAWPARATVPD